MTYARNKALGAFGENLASDHLRSLGMVILDRNWTSRFGEIDIVARDGDTLVVCEVKTRTGTSHGTSREAVTPVKAARLRRLASAWLQAQKLSPPAIRIDVVAVQVPARGAPVIEQITGVA